MITQAIVLPPVRISQDLDQGMAGAAAQLRQLAADHAEHEHAQMLSAIASLIDALLVDGATRH
jgi:hypothetical protein